MSVRTLESRFEHMSVQDENDLGESSKLYTKTKVGRPPLRLFAPGYDSNMVLGPDGLKR